jgi:membrane protein
MYMKIWHHFYQTFRVFCFRFENDRSFLRASSLTFQSLLSIVPVLAVMFGIAKGFGFATGLEEILRTEFHDQQEVLSYLIQFGYRLLEQTQGGIIAGIGIIILLFTVMRLFSNIEDALNAMLSVPQGRPLARKASDYLALILLCPLLILVSSSVTFFVKTKLESISDMAGAMVIPIIPYIVSTFLFTMVYCLVPYTSVKRKSALYAGLFTGCAYQIFQATYIAVQIKISNAGAIYGSFAALPLFLMWIYLSWLLFLSGAQIMVIHQEELWNSSLLAVGRALSQNEEKIVSIACAKLVIDAFMQGTPIQLDALAKKLRFPERVIIELTEKLQQNHILMKAVEQDMAMIAFVPARAVDTIRVGDVIAALEGENKLSSENLRPVEKCLLAAKQEFSHSKYNLLLKDL